MILNGVYERLKKVISVGNKEFNETKTKEEIVKEAKTWQELKKYGGITELKDLESYNIISLEQTIDNLKNSINRTDNVQLKQNYNQVAIWLEELQELRKINNKGD